jgi:hypothetical protein
MGGPAKHVPVRIQRKQPVSKVKMKHRHEVFEGLKTGKEGILQPAKTSGTMSI